MGKIKPNQPMKYAAFISPDGKIYSCPRGGHISLAWRICESLGIADKTRIPDDTIIELGWLKLTSNGNVYFHFNPTITQKQVDALADIMMAEFTEDPPQVIKNFGGDGDRYIHGTNEEWVENVKSAIAMYSYCGRIV